MMRSDAVSQSAPYFAAPMPSANSCHVSYISKAGAGIRGNVIIPRCTGIDKSTRRDMDYPPFCLAQPILDNSSGSYRQNTRYGRERSYQLSLHPLRPAPPGLDDASLPAPLDQLLMPTHLSSFSLRYAMPSRGLAVCDSPMLRR